MKTLLRKEQMKYIDVEGMRVVTNDKHIAEQIKSVTQRCPRASVY